VILLRACIAGGLGLAVDHSAWSAGLHREQDGGAHVHLLGGATTAHERRKEGYDGTRTTAAAIAGNRQPSAIETALRHVVRARLHQPSATIEQICSHVGRFDAVRSI